MLRYFGSLRVMTIKIFYFIIISLVTSGVEPICIKLHCYRYTQVQLKQNQECTKCKPRVQYNLGHIFSYLPDKPKISNARHSIQRVYIMEFENKPQYVVEVRQPTSNPREKFQHQKILL